MSSHNQLCPKKIQDLQPSIDVLVPENQVSTLSNFFEGTHLQVTNHEPVTAYPLDDSIQFERLSISTESTTEGDHIIDIFANEEKPKKPKKNDRAGSEYVITETDLEKSPAISSEVAENEGGKEELDVTSSDASYFSWPEIEIPGSWGTYGIEENPWDDEEKPFVRFKEYGDLKLTPQEKSGILTERIIASCSSYLDKCPLTGKYVLCKCNLAQKVSKKGLKDILFYHRIIQYKYRASLPQTNALNNL